MSEKSTGKVIRSVNVGKKKVQVRFNDEVIKISPETYLDFKLYPGKEISDKEYKAILKRDKYGEAYNYALGLLSKYTYSVSRLEEKLTKNGFNKADIASTIKKLKESNLINDEDYVNNYIELANDKLYGEYKIRQELILKGIDKEYVDSLVFKEKDEIKKLNQLVKLLDKKYVKDNYEKRKEHIYSALLRYGYSGELIKSALEDIAPKDDKLEKESLKKEYEKAKLKYKGKYKGYELENKINEYLLRKGYKYNDIMLLKGKR